MDIFISSLLPDLSRSYIAKQIVTQKVTVNKRLAVPGLKLKPGDIVYFSLKSLKPKPTKLIDLPLIYEDDFCLIIDKPSGILTHQKGFIGEEATVASFILPKLDIKLSGNRAGIVHRLDRGTSGVIIAGKTDVAVKYLQRQFAKRQIKKTYLALIKGKPEQVKATINMPIERNPNRPSTFRVGPNGKAAETYYEIIKQYNDYTMLKIHPKTGRTHQIRVHLKAIGHPIVGDVLYGGEPAERIMLHASELEVILPNKGRLSFNSPLPGEFNDYLTVNHG